MQKLGEKRKMDKFNFYYVYLEEMNRLSGREFKKLVNALSKYADTGELPKSLSKKSSLIFNQVIRVINQEKRLTDISYKRSLAGKKGMKSRWNNKK